MFLMCSLVRLFRRLSFAKNSYNSCGSSISENTQTRQTPVVYSHFEQTVWRKTFKGAEQGKFCI